MYLSRPNSAEGRPDHLPSAALTHFQTNFPALWEYLTFDSYPDGGARQTSTLLFFIEEGSWKVCLCDRAAERTLWATGDTQEDCMLSLEASLQEGRPQWRQSRQRPAKRSK